MLEGARFLILWECLRKTNHALLPVLWARRSLNSPMRGREECRDVNRGRHFTIFYLEPWGIDLQARDTIVGFDKSITQQQTQINAIKQHINILEKTRNDCSIVNKEPSNNITMILWRERTMPIHWTNRAVAPAHVNPGTYNDNQYNRVILIHLRRLRLQAARYL